MTTQAPVRLREQVPGFAGGGPAIEVDTEGGVIRNVALLGLQSRNDRSYLKEAVQRADKDRLFEGRQVYVDHIEEGKDGEVRTFRHLIGVTANTRWDESTEMERGDLHISTKDDHGAKFLEFASRPELQKTIGMSQDAVGRVEEQSGREVVTELGEIISVDVVTRPATTNSLKESEQRKEAPVTKLLEMLKPGMKVSLKAAEGDDPSGVVAAGPFFQVKKGDGEMEMVPADLIDEMEETAEEPSEEPTDEMEGGDDEEKKDEVPVTEMGGDEDDEKHKEAKEADTLSATERAELLRLREKDQVRSTEDYVRKVTGGMTERLAEKVQTRFAGKVATKQDVDTYVSDLKEALEAFQQDVGQTNPVSGFGPAADESHEGDETLLREALVTLGGKSFAGKDGD